MSIETFWGRINTRLREQAEHSAQRRKDAAREARIDALEACLRRGASESPDIFGPEFPDWRAVATDITDRWFA